MSSLNAFLAMPGSLWVTGGALILQHETPFAQDGGGFVVASVAVLPLAPVYRVVARGQARAREIAPGMAS